MVLDRTNADTSNGFKMNGRAIRLFPTHVSEFFAEDEDFFKELVKAENRIGSITDELNLATVPNITSSYGCKQVRFKLSDYLPDQYNTDALNYEWEDDEWISVRNSICASFMAISKIYIEQHFKNYDFDFNPIVKNLYVQDMWVVRYQQGDYNYFHTHPNAVLSSALFLEVPPQIHHEKNFPDGYLALIGDTVNDENSLRFSKQAFIKPEVGKMVVFPASLGHQVYPFKGEGTRKVISVNWGRDYQEKNKRS